MVESTSDDSESSDADAASGGSGGPEAIDKDTEEQKLIGKYNNLSHNFNGDT